jgi:hypothetical protein
MSRHTTALLLSGQLTEVAGNLSYYNSVHSNDNGVRVVNFATSKNLTVKSTMFPHRNIHKFTWDQDVGGWTILKLILERWDGMVGIGSIWLRIGTSGGLL